MDTAAKTKVDATIRAGRLVEISGGTKAIDMGVFYFDHGSLVKPYVTTVTEMHRNYVVEVERVRIAEGKFRGLEGWVDSSLLSRVLVMP